MHPSLLVTLLAAFAAAILSGMGVGSAGIFVLYLTLIAGFSQPDAQAVNLLFFLLSAGAALLLHVRERIIPRRVVPFLIACAIPGAFLGCYLARVMDATLLRRLFGGMLTVTGIPSLLSRRSPGNEGQRAGSGSGT
jgi:uncharacterized membrane protein YfcA